MIIAKVKFRSWVQRVSNKSHWGDIEVEAVEFTTVEELNKKYSDKWLVDFTLFDTEKLKPEHESKP